ncbi:MAG TPA: hypothetical protein VHZ50_19440, partial [Puia sp.]|nr:hypothetical protein [Puia sp.]
MYPLLKMDRFFQSRRGYYTAFAIAYGTLWFVFKLGGIPQPALAFVSTGIDVFFSLLALIITVEVLLPHLVNKKTYWSFGCLFFLVVIITGTSIIVSQLKLFGYGIHDYEKN